MNKNRPFKCDICECTFVQRGKLINHVDAVHEKKKPFKCEFCDYRSSRKENIKSHVESVHEKKKPFKCASCVYSSVPNRRAVRNKRAGGKILKKH